MEGLEVLPVRGIGDVTAGDDLAELITTAAPWLVDGDVLVVTSKIVSKSEGRLVEVPADGPEREVARQEALASETARVVARRGATSIVQTHHGFVMAAAGIDASNVDKTHLVLLPTDPDASARRLRAGFLSRGLDVAIVISDTMGRAWRNGLTDVALGAAGIAPFRDHRGETDPYGNELQITQMAVIDELAAAGELVKGKCDQVPVAVIRGYHYPSDPAAPPEASPSRDAGPGNAGPGNAGPSNAGPSNAGASNAGASGAAALLRDAATDMFSLGTAEARAAGLLDAARLPDGGELPGLAVDPVALERALAAVADRFAPGTTLSPAEPFADHGATVALHLRPAAATPADLMRLGADAHRLRAALAAESIAAAAQPHTDGILLTLSGTAGIAPAGADSSRAGGGRVD
jgi:coenzyme F420-0:L-glutamate ligase/coenzyme F420-1:gamma-L-glutamate ligase